MNFNIGTSKQILLLLVLSCFLIKVVSNNFRGQPDEGRREEPTSRRAKKDTDKDKNHDTGDDREDRFFNGNRVPYSLYPCQTVQQLNEAGRTFFPAPEDRTSEEITNNVIVTENTCTCNDGCCRLYAWLLCDPDDDLYYIPCLCNANTGFPGSPDFNSNIPIDALPPGIENTLNNGIPDRTIGGGINGITITIPGPPAPAQNSPVQTSSNGGTFTVLSPPVTDPSENNNGALVIFDTDSEP